MKRLRIKWTVFAKSHESSAQAAKVNEAHFNFEAAARIYREAGMHEDAQRCERVARSNKFAERERGR